MESGRTSKFRGMQSTIDQLANGQQKASKYTAFAIYQLQSEQIRCIDWAWMAACASCLLGVVTWSALVKLQPTLQVENRRISPPFLKEALWSSKYKVINCILPIAVSDEIVLVKAPYMYQPATACVYCHCHNGATFSKKVSLSHCSSDSLLPFSSFSSTWVSSQPHCNKQPTNHFSLTVQPTP